MKEIKASEFDSEVLKSDKPALCAFSARSWCGPCRAMQPILEKFAEEVSDKVKIVEIDIDDARELCQEYGVRSVPTLILFKNGDDVSTHVGMANREQLLKLIGD